MYIYFVAVFSVVIVTSALLLLVFRRAKLLNYRMVLAIALSSVLSGLLFPGLFNVVSRSKPGVVNIPELFFVLLSTLVLYIVLAFILGIAISLVIPEVSFKAAGSAGNAGKAGKPVETVETDDRDEHEAVVVENTGTGDNYLADIYSKQIAENGIKDANIEDIAQDEENNLEKSVDSEENIDKMGIETVSDNNPKEDGLKAAENLSISECVDEAFRLKELGDLEGAILYYMYALDKNPDKDLVFWVVLDICVLYKSLGQIDLAQEILSSYVESYSDVMDVSIKDEIERNLSYIQN